MLLTIDRPDRSPRGGFVVDDVPKSPWTDPPCRGRLCHNVALHTTLNFLYSVQTALAYYDRLVVAEAHRLSLSRWEGNLTLTLIPQPELAQTPGTLAMSRLFKNVQLVASRTTVGSAEQETAVPILADVDADACSLSVRCLNRSVSG